MKRTIFAALFAFAFVLLMPAAAQEQEPAEQQEERVSERVEMMRSQLDLTEEQAAKLREAFMAGRDDRAALDSAISKILTPEQQKKFRALRARAAMGRAPQTRGGRTPFSGEREFAGLDLSDEQQTQLRQLMREQRQLADSFRTAIEAILTPEQRARRAEMDRRRSGEDDRMDRRRPGRDNQMDRPKRGRDNQMDRPKRGRDNRVGDRAAARPRLSPEQLNALSEVREEVGEAVRAFAEENPDATNQERREFRAKLRQRLGATMDSVLTVEQRLQMVWSPSRTRPNLELTEEQKASLKEALSAHREAAKAQAEARREQLEALQARLKEILTPEQIEQLNSMRRTGRRWR